MFEQALKVILRHEGGYVNNPNDPGGITNLGVTKTTWEGWTGKPATVADMRALTVEQVAPLYRKRYWDAMRCDDYPPAVALCVFDFGVNAGIRRGVRYLQMVVGVAQDGAPGPNTTAGHVAYGREQSDGTDDIVISETDMSLIEAACNELPLMLDAMAEHERRMESVRVRAATHPDRYDEQRAFANGMREALRIMRDGA
jgi:lysozyme family protein